jgi:hypothetical protein
VTRRYAMRLMKTDIIPFEIVEWRSEKHARIREMICDRDPNWRLVKLLGVVVNVDDQKDQFRDPPVWAISPAPSAPVFSIRRRPNDRWVDSFGNRYELAQTPYRFCDFNLRGDSFVHDL